MIDETTDHFARITPVDPRLAGSVLNRWNLAWYNAVVFGSLVTLGVVWCNLLAATGFYLGSLVGSSAMFSAWFALVFVLVGYLSLLFLSFGYAHPEWPLNRILCRQLIRSIRRRDDRVPFAFDPTLRIVELVPRNRWHKKLCLDAATDLAMIRIDGRGIWMNGDCCRYELPAESILGAEVENVRPPGCYPLYRVTVYVRTAEGTIDLPISYRDHRWGALRSSRRLAFAQTLTDQINAIAKGHLYRPLQPPTVDSSPPTLRWSSNPYAAPAILEG